MLPARTGAVRMRGWGLPWGRFLQLAFLQALGVLRHEQHGGLLCIADHEGAYVDAVPGVEVFGVGERRCFVIPSVDGRNGNDVSVLPSSFSVSRSSNEEMPPA